MAVTPAKQTPSTQPPATPSLPATRLGCGRDVDDVWDNISQPPTEHEQACPYCTQARAELATLAAAAHDLTAADQQDESLRVPDKKLANVLAIVRTEVRRGRTIALQRQVSAVRASPADQDTAVDMPTLTVSELVIATVVRETCDRNPDVEVRRVSIDASASSGTTPTGTARNSEVEQEAESKAGDVEPADIRMDLQATVSRTASIPALITGLRTAIQAAVTAQIGVTVSRIDVDVQDLLDA